VARATAIVLFTDLVGSTELRSRLGEKAAEELRHKHDALIARAVEASSGNLVKNLGDGIMATFTGAADAVDAAMAIQQAIGRHNRSSASARLDVRIGISAGDVVVEGDDYFGTPVIEAARLCSAAAGGQIVASEMVRWLARSGGGTFTPVGDLELKGLPEPVPAVQVEWEALPESSVALPTFLTDIGRIFVGRDGELERLGQLWKEAVACEMRVALLAGEPGVGKTRLAAELARRVHDEGATVLAGRCDEDLGVPYQPFVEALRHFVDHVPDLTGRLGRYGGELVRVVPELAERVPELAAPLRSDPETERYRLFDAVAAWLVAASAEEPLLLVLDDLQWAAKPTLLLLRHVVRAGGGRVLVLGTYRDTELAHDHPLLEVLADLRGPGGVERLSLSGLDDVGVAAIVEQASGRALDEANAALARAVYEETEGNPFFVREVLRHLAESGAVERAEGGWTTRLPVDQMGIPEGVREVVGRRLSRLSSHTNQALRVAAVVGAEFELGVVQAAGELGEEALLGAVEEAVAARVVTEVSATRFRFAHALMRATLYESLTAARKVTLHRKAAQAIEAIHEDALDDYVPALAHHWARASAPAADAARAVAYATRAGDQALAQLAHDEAVAYYRQALEILDAAPGSTQGQRLPLLIALGEAERRAGDAAHRETLLEACRMAIEQDDAEALARGALANTRGMYGSGVGEVDRDRVAALEAALDAAQNDDSSTRARLLAALASELTYAGDEERRVRLADEALAMARRVDDVATLAHVLLQRFFASIPFEVLEELLVITEELLFLADRLDDPVVTAQAFWLRGRVLAGAGDMEESNRHFEMAERLTEDLGQPTLRWLVATTATVRTILAGNLEEGERRAQAGFELGQATGQPEAASYTAIQLFLIRLDQGRLGELEERLTERVAAAPLFRPLRSFLALLLCELDRPDEAMQQYKLLAENDFRGIPRDPAWIMSTAPCAAVCAYLGDRVRAHVLFDLLEPYASQVVFTNGGSLGAVAHYLAILAAASGDFDEAQRRFAVAATTHERTGAPTWLARTRLEWARMLLARAKSGDTERADGLLRLALAAARDRGLLNIERRAVELLGR
jgi:predicted ATPase/class 3 adenylate cyclase